jgi:hypothetical protein
MRECDTGSKATRKESTGQFEMEGDVSKEALRIATTGKMSVNFSPTTVSINVSALFPEVGSIVSPFHGRKQKINNSQQ